MDDQELESMLRDLESDLVERKASLSDPDRIRQAICAYANDLPNHRKPGFIFIGSNDDGSCSGLEISDELLLKISNLKDDGKIQPFPSMSVNKKSINGCMMVLVQVEPSNSPPVRLNGVTWIRVGPRRARATPEEEKRLAERRRSRDLPFDLQPVASATIEDLEIRRSEYPLPALQQLIRNAILHRTYEGTNAPVRIYWFSDRIEIHNPGGPFGLVTKENFGQPGVTDYRIRILRKPCMCWDMCRNSAWAFRSPESSCSTTAIHLPNSPLRRTIFSQPLGFEHERSNNCIFQ